MDPDMEIKNIPDTEIKSMDPDMETKNIPETDMAKMTTDTNKILTVRSLLKNLKIVETSEFYATDILREINHGCKLLKFAIISVADQFFARNFIFFREFNISLFYFRTKTGLRIPKGVL